MVIRVTNLAKSFGDVDAVKDLSFHIQRGTTTALLGSNGAGKTTTMAMLLGLLIPNRGQIRILGEDMLLHRHRVLHRLNFTSPYVDLPGRLSVLENLLVYARLYDVAARKQRINQLAEEFELDDILKRPYRTLSAGQKTRVSLTKALLNEPEVLLLDEPTASLDPDSGDRIRDYLQRYQNRTGATLLLASHNMAEVERLCQQVLIMRYGRIVQQGSPQALIAQSGHNSLEQVFLDVVRS